MARIIIIDDEDNFRAALSRTLAALGHFVVEACDGDEGLALVQNGGIDLVMTDIVMPNKEGLEVLMEMRRNHPHVKVIAMSGGGRQQHADNYLHVARLMGALRVLEKPFELATLREAIDSVLEGDRSGVGPERKAAVA
jgi:DNA-binding NtrC family response regulator